MKSTTLRFTLAAVIAVYAGATARAALVLSEVLFNEVGSAGTGEWIEIYNTGPSSIDLTNYKIGDEEASGQTSLTEGMFQFPSGSSIAAGAVQIVSVDADAFQTIYGFLPTYEVTGANAGIPNLTVYSTWDPDGNTINMSNTNDQAVILDGSDALVDAASWGNTFAFNPGLAQPVLDGQSYERKNVFVDTNTADDWQLGPNPSGPAASRSTPGVARVPEPASMALMFGTALVGASLRRRRS